MADRKDKMKNICSHTHIKIVTETFYDIPEGWSWLQEQDDVDMQKYYIETGDDRVVCVDCAETLE